MNIAFETQFGLLKMMFNAYSAVDERTESQPVTSRLHLDFCSLKVLFALPLINIFHLFAPLVIQGSGLPPGALADLRHSVNEKVKYSGLGCGNERSSEGNINDSR